MPDASSIIATIAAIKHSIDVVKAVKDADYDLDKSILKEKIAVLVDSLLEAKIQANETLDLVHERDEKIAELEDLLTFKSKLVRQNGIYYEIDENENVLSDPYCPQCWEVTNVAVHLKNTKEQYFHCTNCKNNYGELPDSLKIKPARSRVSSYQ